MVAGVHCNRLYTLHADNGGKRGETRDLSSRCFSKSNISFEMRETLKLSEVGDQRCHCDRESFSRR